MYVQYVCISMNNSNPPLTKTEIVRGQLSKAESLGMPFKKLQLFPPEGWQVDWALTKGGGGGGGGANCLSRAFPSL